MGPSCSDLGRILSPGFIEAYVSPSSDGDPVARDDERESRGERLQLCISSSSLQQTLKMSVLASRKEYVNNFEFLYSRNFVII